MTGGGRWWWLGAPALLAMGVVGGLVLGVWLEVREPSPALRGAIAAPAKPPMAAETPPPVAPSAPIVPPHLAAERGALAEQLVAMRQALADEQALLEAAVRARAEAELRLAATRQELAAASVPAPVAAPPPAVVARRPVAPAPGVVAPGVVAPGVVAPGVVASPARAVRGAPRVLVQFQAGSEQAQSAASAIGGQLREAGTEGVEVRGVDQAPSGLRAVRFFHPEDAASAARLAGRLGRGWAIQDFRNAEQSPPPQTLEVWVPEP